jgi:hypothetical protein
VVMRCGCGREIQVQSCVISFDGRSSRMQLTDLRALIWAFIAFWFGIDGPNSKFPKRHRDDDDDGDDGRW